MMPINNPAVDGYALFQSNLIAANQAQLIEHAHIAHKRFETAVSFNRIDSTKSYGCYNIFSLTVGSKLFFAVYKELMAAIKHVIPDGRELWFQCWLNYHMPHEVLKLHCHVDCLMHGYLSLDPKNTSTVFKNYSVKNEVGKIYIGPSNIDHEVIVHEPYTTPRITMAFDIVDAATMQNNSKQFGFDINLSYIPVQ
jgi:hypothetical protein